MYRWVSVPTSSPQRPRGHGVPGPHPARYTLEVLRRVPPPTCLGAPRPITDLRVIGPAGPGWSRAGLQLGAGGPPGESATQSLPHCLLPPSPAGGAAGIRGCRGVGGGTGRGKGKGAGEELVREPEFLNGLTWPPVENPCGVGRLRSCAWCTHKTKRPSWKKKIISLAMPGAACQARSSATGSGGCRAKSNFARSLATTVSPSSHASSVPRPGAGSPRTRRSGPSTRSSA